LVADAPGPEDLGRAKSEQDHDEQTTGRQVELVVPAVRLQDGGGGIAGVIRNVRARAISPWSIQPTIVTSERIAIATADGGSPLPRRSASDTNPPELSPTGP
jgi:hypothetical protein